LFADILQPTAAAAGSRIDGGGPDSPLCAWLARTIYGIETSAIVDRAMSEEARHIVCPNCNSVNRICAMWRWP
jgi:hypothetical protein